MDRADAIDRVEAVVDAVETETMPVPVREVWVFGDVALGLDPVDRVDVYLTKDVLFGTDDDREAEFADAHGIEGVGKTVRAEWAEEYPQHLRAGPNGYAAPEKCLAAHLLPEDEPFHLEVCNAPFEDNVRRRLEGARAREDWTQVLDPRGVALWIDGHRSEDALEKLRDSELPFPPLSESLEMLGLEDDQADAAARAVHEWREGQEGATVRGDVV